MGSASKDCTLHAGNAFFLEYDWISPKSEGLLTEVFISFILAPLMTSSVILSFDCYGWKMFKMRFLRKDRLT